MRIIDSEAHAILPHGVADLYRVEADDPAGTRQSDVVAAQSVLAKRFEFYSTELLAHMDQQDVEMTLIMRGYYPAFNSDIAQLVDSHPDRFLGFAAWDMEEPNEGEPEESAAAMRTLERGLSMPQMKGVGEVSLGRFHPHLSAEEAVEQFVPTLEACAAQRCPVMFHTSLGGGLGPRYRDPELLSELTRAFPTVPVLIAHMGGSDETFFKHALDLAHGSPTVFLTTSATTPAFVERAAEEIGADRLLFGSDWSPKTALKAEIAGTTPQAIAIETVEMTALRPAEKQAILGENLAALLGI